MPKAYGLSPPPVRIATRNGPSESGNPLLVVPAASRIRGPISVTADSPSDFLSITPDIATSWSGPTSTQRRPIAIDPPQRQFLADKSPHVRNVPARSELCLCQKRINHIRIIEFAGDHRLR